MLIAGAVYGMFVSWPPVASILCALTGVSLGLLAALAPQRLRLLNSAWLRFGELLGKVVSPIALGFIFFALVTPVSVIGRLFGRDELRLKRRPVASYWIARDVPTLDSNSFKQQF